MSKFILSTSSKDLNVLCLPIASGYPLFRSGTPYFHLSTISVLCLAQSSCYLPPTACLGNSSPQTTPLFQIKINLPAPLFLKVDKKKHTFNRKAI